MKYIIILIMAMVISCGYEGTEPQYSGCEYSSDCIGENHCIAVTADRKICTQKCTVALQKERNIYEFGDTVSAADCGENGHCLVILADYGTNILHGICTEQ